MIGYWHKPVVRLSVRLSVTLCIVALKVGVGAKSCSNVFLAYMFLFVPFDTFSVGCIV